MIRAPASLADPRIVDQGVGGDWGKRGETGLPAPERLKE